MKDIFLKIYYNQQLIGVKQFRTDRVVLGSGNVDIRLEGLLLAHAEIIKRKDGHYYIVTGPEFVFIKGQWVKEYLLSTHEFFQIGPYQIEVYLGFPEAVSLPPIQPIPQASSGGVQSQPIPPPASNMQPHQHTPALHPQQIQPIAPPSGTPPHTAPPPQQIQPVTPPSGTPPQTAPPPQQIQPIAPPSGTPPQIAPPPQQTQPVTPPPGTPPQTAPPPQQTQPVTPPPGTPPQTAPPPQQTQPVTPPPGTPPQTAPPPQQTQPVTPPPGTPPQAMPLQPPSQTPVTPSQAEQYPPAITPYLSHPMPPAPPPPQVPLQQQESQESSEQKTSTISLTQTESAQLLSELMAEEQTEVTSTQVPSQYPDPQISPELSQQTQPVVPPPGTIPQTAPIPQSTQPVTPQPTQSVAPQPTQPVAPQPTQPVAPQPTQPVTPQPTQSVAPQPTQPVIPQQAVQVQPQVTQQQIPPSPDISVSATKSSKDLLTEEAKRQPSEEIHDQVDLYGASQMTQKAEMVSSSSPTPITEETEEDTVSLHKPRKSYRKKATFASSSDLKDINERIKPEEGSVIKVLVTWNEKILNTLYFDSNSTVTVGSHPKSDILLPVFGSSQYLHKLIKISNLASLSITHKMKGVLVKNSEHIPFDDLINSGAANRSKSGFNIDLQRGEMARVDFENGLSIFVKYTAPTPKPLLGPFLALTSGQLNGLIMAIGSTIVMAIFFLMVHEPIAIEPEDELEERTATFVYKKPPPPRIEPIPVVKKEPPKPIKIKPRKVKPKEKPKKRPQPQQVAKTKPKQPVKRRVVRRAKEGARPKDLKPVSKKTKSKQFAAGTSKNGREALQAKRGAGKGGGSGAKAEGRKKKDINQIGLLGTFSKGGLEDTLRTASDGAGVVGGAARKARGAGGSASGRGGVGAGGGLAAIGRGGKGESTYGIPGGVKTRGRGGGTKGYGFGSLGGKSNVRVDLPGGVGETITGMMDKEAIRKVVRRNLRQLRTCYERLAQRNSNISGRIDFNWTIISNGRVGEVKVTKTQINDARTLDCMKRRLSSWRFPDPPEGVIGDINYPFVFITSRQ